MYMYDAWAGTVSISSADAMPARVNRLNVLLFIIVSLHGAMRLTKRGGTASWKKKHFMCQIHNVVNENRIYYTYNL